MRAAPGSSSTMVSPPPGVSSASSGAALRLGQPAGDRQARGRPRRRRGVAEPLERLEHPAPRSPAATPGPWSTTRSATRVPVGAPATSTGRRCGAGRWRPGWPAPARAGRRRPYAVGQVGRRPHALRVRRARPARRRRPRRAARRSATGWTAPVCSRLMSSRSLTIAVSRAVDSSMASSSSARSSGSSRVVVARAGSRRPSGARPAACAGRGRPRRAAPYACGCRPRARGRPRSAGPAPRARAARRGGRRRRRARGARRRPSDAPRSTSSGVRRRPATASPAATGGVVGDQLGGLGAEGRRGPARAAAGRRTRRRGPCG